MTGMVFCVAGLSCMMIGFFALAGNCDLSVVLGTLIGSAASLLGCSIHAAAARVSAKCDAGKAGHIVRLSGISRALFVSMVAAVILLVPVLHDVAGIAALFFPQISRAFISFLKS